MEVQLPLLPISGTASGTLDLTISPDTGIYFTSIFFGITPEATVSHSLVGTSDNITSVEFQKGATFSGGSILIGSSAVSGALQSVSLLDLTVVAGYQPPILEDDNVEDFS